MTTLAVLAQEGVTDLDRYRAMPGGGPLESDLFLDPLESDLFLDPLESAA